MSTINSDEQTPLSRKTVNRAKQFVKFSQEKSLFYTPLKKFESNIIKMPSVQTIAK